MTSVCIISIIRIPTLRQGASSPDPTFTNVSTALWSLAELQTAILCTSLPILRPIVAKFVQGISPSNVDNAYHHERPDRFAGRPAQQRQPWDESQLLHSTGPFCGSTLRSGQSATRPDLHNEVREQESESQHRPTSPIAANVKAVTIVDIEDGNFDNRQNRRSSTMVMRGSVSATPCTTANSITTSSHIHPFGVFDITPAPHLCMIGKNPYSLSPDKIQCRMFPHDLRIPSPGLETCQSTAKSRFQATMNSSSIRASDSLTPPENSLWTPTTTPAASTREMQTIGSHPKVSMPDGVAHLKEAYEGKINSSDTQKSQLLDPLDAEESSAEEIFGLTMVNLSKSKDMHPVATSWLRLTPELEEDP